MGLLLGFAAAVQANTPDPQQFQPLKPSHPQAVAAHLAASLIGEHHYRPLALNDTLSEKTFDAYLKALDGERMFFLKSDIDQLQKARTQLDDAVLSENLELPFAIFNLYAKRAVERFSYARSLLKTGFDFSQNESYRYQRENEPWAKTDAEVRDLWRKRVKNDWLQLKLTGKDDEAIAEVLGKRYENFLKRMAKLKSEDAFQIFMNAYTMSVDPHTNYMAPRTTEDFDISMRLSLVGIGAVLEEKDDYATIKELVPGSPAALSEQLKAGDRIAGVAQGANGTMTDVVGWRLDDTVALIRGTADTTVVLDVIPAGTGPDSQHKLVSLIRKKIRLEDQAAKKSVLTLTDKGLPRRIGVISLPTFYEDFAARQKGDEDYKSATRDVSRLLAELKEEKVDAVLVDLRNNGGGSLSEAIELTGLFLGSGPVVQQRNAQGEINVAKGLAPGAVWTGPLGVLINRGSASASEIFAAAVQDYGRGLVIGDTSFGKGTVQTMINLDRLAHHQAAQLGDLKLTVAQFFRINGSTTQLRGVTPDIALPTTADAEHFGESSYDNGLPWMQVKPADYHAVADLHSAVPVLQQRHERRAAADKDYQNLLEDIADFNQRRNKPAVSLNEKERRAEHDAQEAKLKARDPEAAKASGTADPGTPENGGPARNHGQDPGKPDKKGKDPLLTEAACILGDAVELEQARLEPTGRSVAKSERPDKDQLTGESQATP
jgi:carboxyl-terminal processing protease